MRYDNVLEKCINCCTYYIEVVKIGTCLSSIVAIVIVLAK